MYKSAIELLKSKEYLKIDFENDIGYIIEFRLNVGKGTAPIRIPVKFMEDVIGILEKGPQIVEENNLVDTIRNSLAFYSENDEEFVIFRTRHGRGSKIHKIRKNEYQQVVELLKNINQDIPDVIAKYEDLNY